MKNIIINIISAILLITTISKGDAQEEKTALQIHMPGEITVESNAPNLGQIAIIRGNELLSDKAEKITLGRISAPGQKIIIDRATLLGRLVCSGIPASEVTLTGAEKTTISQQHQIIKGNEFAEKALTFLKNNPPETSICQYNAARIPQDLILSDTSKDIRLSSCLVSSNIKHQAKVLVSVFSGDKEIGTREVTFTLKYNCRRMSAKIDIPQGAVISPENINIENTVSNYPEPANWVVPYGFIAKRHLSANTIISMDMVGPVQPQVVLKRNQTVIIKIDRLGLLVTAIGKAMQDGRIGEYIKVQNLDSQRVIMAKVNEDGSVEPIF